MHRCQNSGNLTSAHLGPLARLCLETTLDSADRSLRAALFACDEEDTVLLREQRLRTLASLADNVLGDVPSQHILNLLRLESPTNRESLRAVHGTDSSQLGEEVLNDVVGLSMHTLADVDNVGKKGLLGTIPRNLGRNHGELLLLARESRVLRTQRLEDTAEQLLVRVVPVRPVPRLGLVLLNAINVVVLSEGVVAKILLVLTSAGLTGIISSLAELLLERLKVKGGLLAL